MAKITLPSLALVLSLVTLPLVAQTEDAPTQTPAPQEGVAPQDGVAAPDDLSMGAEVGPADRVGSTYVAASFEAWEQRCVRTEAGVDPCQLYLLLKDTEGNSVAEFTMFGLPAGSEGPAVAGATFIAPLETLLTAGMTLQIDSGAAKAYPFTFCAQMGCIARLGFTAADVEQMKRGANAVVTIVPFVAPDQKVTLTASLKGFTAGLNAVNAANELADAAAAKAGTSSTAPAAND